MIDLKKTNKLFYSLAGGLLFAYLLLTLKGLHPVAGWALLFFFICLAVGFRGDEKLKGLSFTLFIFGTVSLAMYNPGYFLQWGDFKLSNLVTPLIQLIMFGMGTSMSMKDFAAVIKTPKGVVIGVMSQFVIMPLLGYTLATTTGFPPEIAAGVVLIGCSPSGLASNVMCYLAKANLALVVFIHNSCGYFLGYWSGRLFKMSEKDCRTIAIEVGMQNAGLASGIAKEMGKIATVGLAPAVFAPLMNITGSILASWWHNRPPGDESTVKKNP